MVTQSLLLIFSERNGDFFFFPMIVNKRNVVY